MNFLKKLFNKKPNSPTLFVNLILLDGSEFCGKYATGSLQENLARSSTVVFMEENEVACTVVPMSQVKYVEFYYYSVENA